MTSSEDFALGAVHFDAASGELRSRAGIRRLEPRAATVLKLLCEQPGALVSRQRLLDGAWGMGEGSDEALTQAISQVRRALEELGEGALIETLSKRGYRLRLASYPHSAGNAPERPRRGYPLLLVALTAATLLAITYAEPHALRHMVRHTLGLGPPASSSH